MPYYDSSTTSSSSSYFPPSSNQSPVHNVSQSELLASSGPTRGSRKNKIRSGPRHHLVLDGKGQDRPLEAAFARTGQEVHSL